MADELDDLRRRINDVDHRLIEALAERQRIVEDVARHKRGGGTVVRDRDREEAHLAELVAQGRGAGLDGWFVTRVFQELIDHSLRRQEVLLTRGEQEAGALITVAFQGTEGSYSHLACKRHFSAHEGDVVFRGYPTFEQMLEAVVGGGADFGVLPIENTTAGSINDAYDLLARMDLAVVGEEIQRIEHCLLALQPVPLSHIRRIYSQAPALAQCTRFLSSLSHVHVESFTDTAMAVKKVLADQDLSQAAIASEEAGRLYGLHVVKRQIADQRENFTRFLVVTREPVAVDPRIPCKTSILFATTHDEGALLRCLNVLADHHLNLTKLESRPRPNVPWEYLFYVDFEGNVADEAVQAALAELTTRTRFLKVLGSYAARNTRKSRPAEPRRKPREEAGAPEARRAGRSPAPRPAEAAAPEVARPWRLASRAHRAEDTVIALGSVRLGGPGAVLVAGPGAVESEEQILACARAAREAGAHLLRADCFRAPTDPSGFQGLGFEGVDLLEAAGASVGLPTVTAVRFPRDVARVARQVDVLEVGDEHMQNLELLEAVARVDRPVILRRGMMASVDEWLAAADYVLARGNHQVILCERGIRTFETATHHTLDLTVVPVVREGSHLPVLVDPGPAVGARRFVPPLAEAALAAGASGVIVEIHPDPAAALADGAQALDLAAFEALAERLRPWLA